MILVEKKEELCTLCGAQSLFKVCFSCTKENASKYPDSHPKPFPDPANSLELEIARFITTESDQGFDEAAFSTAIAHYMMAVFGVGHHRLRISEENGNGSNGNKPTSTEFISVEKQLHAQYYFLERVLEFLEKNQDIIRENRVINVSTLLSATEKIEQEMERLRERANLSPEDFT